MKKSLEVIIGILFLIGLLSCKQQVIENQNWQWRGENRDGIYLKETGLLKVWPDDGPELLWHFDKLGEGHTSVAISTEKIYITGMHDDRLILYVLDMTGKLLVEKEIGKEWNANWNGTRSSVCINDGKLYIFNALGTLFCLDQTSLQEVWKKELIAEYGCRNLMFGITENPLIVGDKIFMTTGGETHNMIALDKHTGGLIWTSQGTGMVSSYCSPLYIAGQDVPMVVTWMSPELIMGGSQRTHPPVSGGGAQGTPPAGHGVGQQGTPPAGHGGGQQGTPPAGHGVGQQGTPPAGHGGGQQGTPPAGHGGGQQGTPPAGHGGGQQGTPPAGPGGRPQGVMHENVLAAFNAETGELLWTQLQPSSNTINPNTPLYADGMLLSFTGYRGGAWLRRLKDGGRSAELVWHNNEMDNQMGGIIKVGDYLYAAGHQNRSWFCVDWNTGETVYKVSELAPANVIFADGMIYVYSEKGTMNLVKPTPEKLEIVSSFNVTLGTNQHWAHPVIHRGILYIRHGDTLMAYKVK